MPKRVALWWRSDAAVKTRQLLIIPTAAAIGGAYSDWASEARMQHRARKRQWLAMIIPPMKIARTYAGKRRNLLPEDEAE